MMNTPMKTTMIRLCAALLTLCFCASAWGAPDLIVREIQFSNEQPLDGDPVTISAIVENIGAAALTDNHDIDAWFFEDDPDSGALQIMARNTITGLAPGETGEIIALFRPRAGRWNIHAIVNPDPERAAFQESNLNNNEASRELIAGPRVFPPSTQEMRQRAVERGVQWILGQQGEQSVKCPQDGTLNPKIQPNCVICRLSLSGLPVRKEPSPAWNPIGGSPADTALAAFTLLASGMEPSHPNINGALQYLLEANWNDFSAYDFALVILAFSATQQRETYLERMQFAVQRLEQLQIRSEKGASPESDGGWGYGRMSVADGAHMHYVIYALYTAGLWGAKADEETLRRAEQWVRSVQHSSGGWNYNLIESPWAEGPYGSMTATGLMALKMLGATPADEAYLRGMEWIDKRYTVANNPGSFNWHYYYLLAIQRAMDAPPKQAALMGRNWYDDMANAFAALQMPDGRWEESDGETFASTCFAVLFLTRYIPPAAAPDLSIAPGTLRLTPSAPAAGDEAALRATFVNRGKPLESPTVTIALYDGHPARGGKRIAEQPILFPQNRADATGNLIWTVPREGKYDVVLAVDPDEEFEDLDRSNNAASIPVNAAPEGTSAADREQPIRETQPNLFEIGPPGRAVVLDLNRKEARLNGKSAASTRLVEYLATTPLGKVHETALTFDVEPAHLQAALLALKLKPENNLRAQGDPRTPAGDPVDLFVEWQRAGQTERIRAEQLLWNEIEDRPMSSTHWVFTGSRLRGRLFMADASQSLIATFRDPDAILNHPLPSGADDMSFRVNLKTAPPRGEPVTLIIRPAHQPARQKSGAQ